MESDSQDTVSEAESQSDDDKQETEVPLKKSLKKVAKVESDKNQLVKDLFCPEIMIGAELQEHFRRLEAQNRKSLFLNRISKSVSDEDIKALSKDITSVRRPRSNYCFLEFDSEKVAEENIKKLQNILINGQEVFVDYVGPKSNLEKDNQISQLTVNKLKLQVKGLDKAVTEDDLKAEFSESLHVQIKKTKQSQIGIVSFQNKELAKRAYDSCGEKVIKGKPVIVVYSIPANKQNQIKKQKKKKKLFDKIQATKKIQAAKKKKVIQAKKNQRIIQAKKAKKLIQAKKAKINPSKN